MTYEGEEPIEVNGKKVVAFKESGEWTIPEGVTNVDVLVVAGGGGGGSGENYGGGGGAGGLIFRPNLDIGSKTSPITITVGTGGTGATGEDNGQNGNDSVFADLTAKGGGGGGKSTGSPVSDGADGGSGGGTGLVGSGGTGTQPTQSSDSGTYGYGNDGGGGVSYSGSDYTSAGGGGAGYAGKDGTNQYGDGGDGLKEVTINSTTYNFATIFGNANTGESLSSEYWYAGGGGGAEFEGDRAGNGGKGGGADGGAPRASGNPGDNATNNTGGGGGGGNWDGGNGGNGGSGIVIIAYEELPFIIKGKVTLNSTNVEGAKVRLINDTTDSYVGDTLTDSLGDYEFEVANDTDDFHAMVEYESGGNKYHAVSYPFIKGGEDE